MLRGALESNFGAAQAWRAERLGSLGDHRFEEDANDCNDGIRGDRMTGKRLKRWDWRPVYVRTRSMYSTIAVI